MKKVLFATPRMSGVQSRQIKTHLLCVACEEKFNKQGENYLLNWVGPNAETFPLREKMMAVASLGANRTAMVPASVIGVDTEKFAYFVLSVIWRAAVKEWRLPDRSLSSLLDLGAHEEPIRQYLNNEGPFPLGIVVTVAVNVDQASRERFFIPTLVTEPNGWKAVSLLTRGVFFRLYLGSPAAEQLSQFCCTSPLKPLFLGNGERKVLETYGNLSTKPVSEPEQSQ